MDIVALAYNLCDVDFLTMSPPPEESAIADSTSFDLYNILKGVDNPSDLSQQAGSTSPKCNEHSPNAVSPKIQCDSPSQSGTQDYLSTSNNQPSDDIPMIDLTSPAPAGDCDRVPATEPISPPDSTASSKPESTSTSPAQASLLHSPESLCSSSSCGGDLSNASSLLLQGNKGSNDDSIIEFLLSQDAAERQTQQQQRSTRTSLESGKRKQPIEDPEETPASGHQLDTGCLPELNIDDLSTQKLDSFYKNIPDIRNEYLGKPSECPCVNPYMFQSDWLQLIARCPPSSPHVCRSSACEPPPAKRHCSPPQHRQFVTSPSSGSSQVSPIQVQHSVRPISNALYNKFSLGNPQLRNCSQSLPRNPQFPPAQYRSVPNNAIHSSHDSRSLQNTPFSTSQQQHEQQHQNTKQQKAFTTTQRLSVLSGVTYHGPSTTLSTAAQERAEKLKGKPSDTYIALIARAILSSPNLTTSLPDIYEQIMIQQPFYRTSTLAWRNAVRHNLSINECFVKVGKADSGRGWKWTIHPSCVEQFRRGDFRRREARSKVQQVHKKTVTPAPYQAPHRNY